MSVIPEPSYIKLVPQQPTRLRADRWWWEEREINDPANHQVKKVKIMVFHVTEKDGNKVDTTFSVLSIKLQTQLAPLVESGQLFYRPWTVTWNPRGYATEYTVSLG